MNKLGFAVLAGFLAILTACGSGSMGTLPPPPHSPTPSVNALPSFTSATQLMIDSTTSAANGPANPVSISHQSPIAVTINGYGVAILKLQ